PSLTTAITNAGSYLRSQQCTENGKEGVEGAFRSSMGLEEGTCNSKTPFPSETEFNENAVEIDSTGFAIEALWNQGIAASKTAARNGGKWMNGKRVVTSPPKRIYWQ